MSDGRDRMVRLVGERYADCGFGNFNLYGDHWTSLRREARDTACGYGELLKRNRANGRNLILYGAVGTGKDHLAAAVVREALVAGLTVASIRGVQLAHEILRSMWSGDQMAEKYHERDLLLISDIEPKRNESATPACQAGLLDLLDRRYIARLPTVVTSNVFVLASESGAEEPEGLELLIGGGSVSRLRDGAVEQFMEWPDHRITGGQDGR